MQGSLTADTVRFAKAQRCSGGITFSFLNTYPYPAVFQCLYIPLEGSRLALFSATLPLDPTFHYQI